VLTPAGLVIALVISAPALWDAANGSLGMGAALIRLAAAFVVVAIGTAILQKVMTPQRRIGVPPDDAGVDGHPARRRDDA
jgi:hypothetical protein